MVDSARNNSQCNISLRLDQDNDNSISMERLKTWTPQNFTSILNNPQYSFYEDMKNKLYSGIYDSTSNYELTDLSKDFEKFTDIGSPRSQASSRSSKISFKDLLNESYEDYLNKIKEQYAVYKSNHKRLQAETKFSSVENTDHLYQSSQKIYKIVPKEFFFQGDAQNSQFKISKEILEKKREDIEKYCRELIEKCGDVEFEIERILQHSGKIYNFINYNLTPLSEEINFSYDKVRNMKIMKENLKQKVLVNSAKSIQHGNKRKNIVNMITSLKNIKSLKEILDLLKVLSNNPSKYGVTLDLLNKGKEILSGLQSKKKGSLIKVAKLFEDEFNKFSNKSLDKIVVEFSNVLCDEIGKLVSITEPDESNLQSEYDIKSFSSEYSFDFEKESNGKSLLSTGLKIFQNIKYNKTSYEESKKLKDIFQTLLKLDSEFFSKLRNIVTKSNFDYINNITQSLNSLIYKKGLSNSMVLDKLEIVSVQDTDKLDIIYMLVFNKILSNLEANTKELEDFIFSEIDSYLLNSDLEDKKKEIIRKKYLDEMTEIKNIIHNEIIKIVYSTVSKNLMNTLNYTNIDLFLQNFFLINSVCASGAPNFFKDKNISNLFSKIQNEFVGMYFNVKDKKMRESVYCEDWTAVKIVPGSHQSMTNFICSFNYNEIKQKVTDLSSVLNLFENNEKSLDDDNIQSCLEILCYNSLTGDNIKTSFKLVLSNLDVIKVIFDSLKLLLLFDKSVYANVFSNLSKFLTNFILLTKEFILEGEGFRRGTLKRLSQAEVSITNSTACVLKHLIMSLIRNNENSELNNLLKTSFSDLMVNLDKIRHTCRSNMSDMLNSSIRESIEDLIKIDFSNYPVSPEEEKRSFSEFVKKYHRINSAYASMINAFEDSEIAYTLQEILKIFFDKLESAMKSLSEKNKLTDATGQKQFKRDMTAIKKNLNTFSKHIYNSIEQLQERVDGITKIVLPKVSTKKRLATEDK